MSYSENNSNRYRGPPSNVYQWHTPSSTPRLGVPFSAPADLYDRSPMPSAPPVNRGNQQSDIASLANQLQTFQLNLSNQMESLVERIPQLIKSEVAGMRGNGNLGVDDGDARSVASGVDSEYDTVRSYPISPIRPLHNVPVQMEPRRPRNFYYQPSIKDLSVYSGNDDQLNPKEFIAGVENFFSEAQASDRTRILEAGRLLTHKAATWYQAKSGTFVSFNDFKTRFLSYFWNETKQNKIRSRVFVPGQYRPEMGDMSDYFLNNLKKARFLDDPIPERTLLAAIISHFPSDVQWALTHCNARTEDLVIEKLLELDALPKPSNSSDSFNQQSSSNQNKGMHKFTNQARVNQISTSAEDSLN